MRQRQIENFNFVDVETNVFTLIIKMLLFEEEKKTFEGREREQTKRYKNLFLSIKLRNAKKSFKKQFR